MGEDPCILPAIARQTQKFIQKHTIKISHTWLLKFVTDSHTASLHTLKTPTPSTHQNISEGQSLKYKKSQSFLMHAEANGINPPSGMHGQVPTYCHTKLDTDNVAFNFLCTLLHILVNGFLSQVTMP